MSGLPIVQPGVMDAVTAHVNAAWAKRVGGILVGRSVHDRVRVEGALPARQTEEYAGELAFTPTVWQDAYAELDHYPGARIVGWYHSHPGGGVALSDYDRLLHAALFGEPSNVALVLDPIGQKLAWFGWTASSIAEMTDTEAPQPAGQIPPVRDTPRGRRVAVAWLVAAGLVAAGAGGYWLRDWREDHRPPPSASLGRLVRDQQAGIARLRQSLRQAQLTVTQDEAVLRQMERDAAAAREALEEARRKLREARAEAGTAVIRYRVRPGDTLWIIAQRFLGDPLAWPTILQANRGRIPDPNNLVVGVVLNIRIGS
jgi:proteasome lid subunit RPN8/RPN11